MDKKVFSLYKSATIHTQVRRKIPKQVFVLPVLLLVGLFMGYRIYSSLYVDKFKKTTSNEENSLQVPVTGQGASATGPVAGTQFEQSLLNFTPSIPNIPESAPAYIKMVEVVDFPKKLACMLNESTGHCVCYTQQATVYQTDYKSCYEHVTGKYFNPYIEPRKFIDARQTLNSSNS